MIIKFLSGGALPPLVSFTPLVSQSPASVPATAKETKKSNKGLLDEEILQMLNSLNGLPSDMAVISKALLDFYIDKLFAPDTANIQSRYLKTIFQIKNANFNHELYKDSIKTVTDNGGYDELAMNERGLLLCVNKNDPTDYLLIAPELLTKQNDYVPLTNAEVLNLRAHSPLLANKNNVLKIVRNGIGMKAISNLINLAVTFLGSDTLQLDSYVRSDGKTLLGGLLDYIKAAVNSSSYDASIDNLYRLNELTKSLAEQAKKAIEYVWNMLPINAKTLLKTKTQNGTSEEAKVLVESIITSRASDTHQLSVTIDKADPAKDPKVAKKSSGDSVKNDPVKSFILGKGYQLPVGINLGNSYKYTVNGRYSILVDKQGNALKANDTLEDVTGSAFSSILDINQATFGGVKLNTNQGRKVLLDSADIIGMDLPIDQEAFSRGIVRPDLNLLMRLELADSQIREGNITDPEQINKIYAANNLPEKFKNENGTYKMDLLNYLRFARLSGVVEESALQDNADLDGTVIPIEDDNFRSSIEEVLKSKDKNYNMSDGFLGMGVTDVFRGAIYIPVREDLIAASLGSGNYYDLDDTKEVQEKWDQTQKIQNYVKAPSLGTIL